MKKVLIMAIFALLVAGCAYDEEKAERAYEISKGVYKVGKAGVKVMSDKIDPGTLETLKEVDSIAVKVDEVRTELKKPVAPTPSEKTN